MSDSTANAREPSMEDILASIRRIIDEEDGRDARPASDVEMDTVGDDRGAEGGSLPVMAAAPTGRNDEAGTDGGDDDTRTIFPERGSPFWSRATGRAEGADDDARDDGFDEAVFGAGDSSTASDATVPTDARTDIFRRAQSKLGSTSRPGTRERIQSLAARAEERAENAARDRESAVEPAAVPDRDPDGEAGADSGIDARGEADVAVPTFDTGDVLDLTEPLDRAAPAIDEDRMDEGWDEDAHGGEPDDADTPGDPESLHALDEGAMDATADDEPRDDVLDLTAPAADQDDLERTVERGSVENGDDFHVSEADDTVADEDRSMAAEGDDDDAADGYAAEGAVVANTYSRFDREDDARAAASEADEPDDVTEAHASETGDAPDDSPYADEAEADEAAFGAASFFDADAVDSGSDAPERNDMPEEEPTKDEVSYMAASFAGFEDESADDDIDPALHGDVSAEEAVAEEESYAAVWTLDPEPADGGPDAAIHAETVSEEPVAHDGQEPAGDTDSSFETSRFETGASHAEPDAPVHASDPVDDVATDEPMTDEPAQTIEPAAEAEADVPPEAYTAAFTMLDDAPPAEEGAEGRTGTDEMDLGDDLGFSDTFGASDVYHDDPPVLDEDYSRSFEEEPVTARSSFAADGAEAPHAPRDDGMEKVGGLVRDALERDPVDYADPSALVSMTSEEISARALASLADVEGEASRRVFGSLRISDDEGSESLEGMVRGMLRPMLREWLDDNLPTMVETAVRGEVERISAKSRRYSRAADRERD